MSLQVAEALGSVIINADSRQVYRDIPIGTAAPTAQEQERVKHYFVGNKSVVEPYNAGQYERDVMALLPRLFEAHEVVVLSGGSMMYVDAVCKGLDEIPAVDESIKLEVRLRYEEEGLAWLQEEVQRLDPVYWETVDRCNPQRLIHCIEVSRQMGCAYSTLRTNAPKERPFRIVKVALERERGRLYERINRRVEMMMAQGMEEEARRVYPYRKENSLQTVGYKELFAYMDGEYDLERAVELIQQNSRRYAKRQLTWLRRDEAIRWFSLDKEDESSIVAQVVEMVKG